MAKRSFSHLFNVFSQSPVWYLSCQVSLSYYETSLGPITYLRIISRHPDVFSKGKAISIKGYSNQKSRGVGQRFPFLCLSILMTTPKMAFPSLPSNACLPWEMCFKLHGERWNMGHDCEAGKQPISEKDLAIGEPDRTRSCHSTREASWAIKLTKCCCENIVENITSSTIFHPHWRKARY